MFHVQVVRITDQEVIKTISCATLKRAEKTEAGLLINMNHEKYFTVIVNKDSGTKI